MNFALVTHSLPQPSSNGGPITCWAITKALLDAGHRVSVVALAYPSAPFNTPERRQILRDLGVDLVMVDTTDSIKPDDIGNRSFIQRLKRKIRWLLWPDLASFFPTAYLVHRMAPVIERINPDAIFVYHWDSLAAIHSIDMFPRMTIVDDLWHLPNLRRWQGSKPKFTSSYAKWTLRTMRDGLIAPKFMVQLLNSCEVSGCFQSHSASWLRDNGATNCIYFHSPIIDDCGPEWQRLRSEVSQKRKLKILLGPSDLAITTTRAGLRLFAMEILPILERELGPEKFEVHVVGEGEPPEELKRLLPRPTVILRGRIEPADSEFLSSDIQLVPTPILLGARKRIIVGFSFGCCVVAHKNDAINLPEIVHEENALLASDGQDLAGELIRAARDPGLRERLGAGARRTYERYFTPDIAAAAITIGLEQMAEDRKRGTK